jgi:MurNAc alpha-1-phosphate uridylyltransferase
MKITHAMILAAGLGTRMRPLTNTLPKPLIEVAGKPLIDWCLDWLQAAGIAQVVVNSSYLAEQLEAHVAMRAHPHVTVSREGTPALETGGGVLNALPQLGKEPFITMNSDAIFLPQAVHPVQRMVDAWRDDLDFLMLVVPCEAAHGFSGNGDFVVDDAGRLRRPAVGETAHYLFTGVEIIHPRVFVDCPDGPFSLSVLWKRLEGEDGWYRRMRAVVYSGDWLNVGDLDGLATAQKMLVKT